MSYHIDTNIMYNKDGCKKKCHLGIGIFIRHSVIDENIDDTEIHNHLKNWENLIYSVLVHIRVSLSLSQKSEPLRYFFKQYLLSTIFSKDVDPLCRPLLGRGHSLWVGRKD